MKTNNATFFRLLNIGAILALAFSAYLHFKKKKQSAEPKEVFKKYYYLAHRWVLNHQEGLKMKDYLKEKNYNSIGVYGLGSVGELLINELDKTDIEIKFIVDKRSEDFIGDDIPIISIDEIKNQQAVDAIVVTPIAFFDEIYSDLKKLNVACPIIPLNLLVSQDL